MFAEWLLWCHTAIIYCSLWSTDTAQLRPFAALLGPHTLDIMSRLNSYTYGYVLQDNFVGGAVELLPRTLCCAYQDAPSHSSRIWVISPGGYERITRRVHRVRMHSAVSTLLCMQAPSPLTYRFDPNPTTWRWRRTKVRSMAPDEPCVFRLTREKWGFAALAPGYRYSTEALNLATQGIRIGPPGRRPSPDKARRNLQILSRRRI